MDSPIQKPKMIQDILDKHHIESKVIEFPQSTKTAQDAANVIGCSVAQIAKSIIFQTKETERPVLVLASGANRVNEKTIEAYIGEKVIKADADFIRDVTGFAIGGVSPIGHKNPITLIFIDEDLLTFPEIWAAAGTPNSVFNLKGSDLVKLTNGKVCSVK